MNDDPITVVSSQELRMLMTALSARDNIHAPQEVILSDDARGYLSIDAWLNVMGVSGWLADNLRRVHAHGALSRAVAGDDLFFRLQMVKGKTDTGDYYAVNPPAVSDDTSHEK